VTTEWILPERVYLRFYLNEARKHSKFRSRNEKIDLVHETVAESFDIRPETLVVVFDSNFVRVVVKEEHVDREKSHEAKHFIVLHRQAFVLLDQN
jgi:hypothetical protein